MFADPAQTELLFPDATPVGKNERACTICLEDRIVPYILRRSARRSISLQIDHRGLRVSASQRASITQIEAMIDQHARWVLDKLDEWRTRRRPEKILITDGIKLPYLDGEITIRLANGRNQAQWNEHATQTLTLIARSAERAGSVLEEALRGKAYDYFSIRLSHFAAVLGVNAPKLSLSAARTRWGSCSLLTGIRLNWRLIHFPARVIDYVIIHELAHLIEMNHSQRFWKIVESFCPDYKVLQLELKKLANICPVW